MFLVKSLLTYLTQEISSYAHVLISLEILTITSSTTTGTTTTTIFHHSHRHHHHHNHLDETIFFSCFNIRHKFLDKLIFFNHHQQDRLHRYHCHYHLMIIFFCQIRQFFSQSTKEKQWDFNKNFYFRKKADWRT